MLNALMRCAISTVVAFIALSFYQGSAYADDPLVGKEILDRASMQVIKTDIPEAPPDFVTDCKNLAQTRYNNSRMLIGVVKSLTGRTSTAECRPWLYTVLENKRTLYHVPRGLKKSRQMCDMLLAAVTNPRSVAVQVTLESVQPSTTSTDAEDTPAITSIMLTQICLKAMLHMGFVPDYRR